MSFHYNHSDDENEHHVDDWLMTYADMITLLLCFFAIFLSLSAPKEEQMKQAEKEVKEEFAGSASLAMPDATTTALSEKPLDSMPSIVDRYRGDKGSQPQPGEEIKEEGERITTIEMDSSLFFGSGSAELSADGKAALQKFIPSFREQYKDYLITVEGHTDDSPIRTAQFPSNWELSATRASSVVRYYIEQGIPAMRLRAAGYADAFPKVPNLDGQGKPIAANRAANRRVVIKLEKIE